MKTPPTHRQVRRAIEPQPTQRDILQCLSFCVEVSAEFARTLQDMGQAEPALFESLKGMQLMLDRLERNCAKRGIKTTNEPPPDLTGIRLALAALCSANMSPQQ